MNVVQYSVVPLALLLCTAYTATATPIDVTIDGEQKSFTQVLQIDVAPTPTRKPSGRTLVSGLSYWTKHHKFGSSGLEPDPIASFAATAELDAEYDTVLFAMGFDTGLQHDNGVYTSTGIRDLNLSLRDSSGADILVLSSTPSNSTLINGNLGGLFTFNTGANGGAYVETLFSVNDGSLGANLLDKTYFAVITSGAMHGRAKHDLYFSGMSLTLYEQTTPPVTEVPEPMTAAGLGIGLIAGAIRKRRQKAS